MSDFPVAARPVDIAGGHHRSGAVQNFLINGFEIVVLGDLVEPHGPPPHSPPPPMVQATTHFRVNGIAVCREGHVAECNHPTSGRPNFRIGA